MPELFRKMKLGECPFCGSTNLTARFKSISYCKLSPNGHVTDIKDYPNYVGKVICHKCHEVSGVIDIGIFTNSPGMMMVVPEERVGTIIERYKKYPVAERKASVIGDSSPLVK